MKNSELLQLNPQHLAELRSFFSGFEFDDVEILASENALPENSLDFNTFGFHTAAHNLKLDGVFRGNGRMHTLFHGDNEDDVFYCFSYALVGGVEERIIFKLTLRGRNQDE